MVHDPRLYKDLHVFAFGKTVTETRAKTHVSQVMVHESEVMEIHLSEGHAVCYTSLDTCTDIFCKYIEQGT